MAIYDDCGGVQATTSHRLLGWSNGEWKTINQLVLSPEESAGGQWNTAKFAPIESNKLRIVSLHDGRVRSDETKVTVWNDEESPRTH